MRMFLALEEADQLHQAKRLEREQQEANKKPDSKRYIKIKVLPQQQCTVD